MTRTPASLVLATACATACAAALAACSPTVTVTETETVIVEVPATPSAAPAAPAPTEEPGAFGDWEISPSGIGPLTVGLTAAEVGERTGLDYTDQLDAGDDFCGTFALGGAGALSSMYALAESEGAYGPVDVYTVGANELYDGPFPATADGVTIGSSLTDLDKLYGDGLVIEEWLYDPTWSRAWTLDGVNGMSFLTDDAGEVVSITVGRDPQFLYVEGCA